MRASYPPFPRWEEWVKDRIQGILNSSELNWLPDLEREWVEQNMYFLDGIWERLVKDGDWPDPTELQRQLRAEDKSRRVAQALGSAPRSLVVKEYSPPSARLTVFGLGCVEAAREILEQYLTVARLALERFDSPTLPNRLSRSDVIAELHLDPSEAQLLSRLLMMDAPFLGGGLSSVDDWDRKIDPRAEEFEGLNDVDDFLEFLSRQRGLKGEPQFVALLADSAPAQGEAPEPSPMDQGQGGKDEAHTSLMPAAAVVSALAAVATVLLPIFSSPSIANLAVLGLFVGLTLALLLQMHPVAAAGTVLLLVLIGGVCGAALESTPPAGPHGYFVATTDEADVVSAVIEPRAGAPLVRSDVFVAGSKVEVRCILRRGEATWAELADGAFLPASVLRPEVGGGTASSC